MKEFKKNRKCRKDFSKFFVLNLPLFFCSLGYRPFVSGVQGQTALLSRLVISKQQQQQHRDQQEQEPIPESPSPSPAPSFGSNQRGNISRSRRSSASHASTTATLEEELTQDSFSGTEESSIRGSYGSLSNPEKSSSREGCVVS